MKKFQFSLSRMQDFKNQILDKEKNLLGQLKRNQLDLETQIESLIRKQNILGRQLTEEQSRGTTAAKLLSYSAQIENIRMQLKQLHIDLENAIVEVDCQTKVVVAASQEVSSLDKLKERQWEEYRLEEARSNETAMLEYVTVSLTHGASMR